MQLHWDILRPHPPEFSHCRCWSPLHGAVPPSAGYFSLLPPLPLPLLQSIRRAHKAQMLDSPWWATSPPPSDLGYFSLSSDCLSDCHIWAGGHCLAQMPVPFLRSCTPPNVRYFSLLSSPLLTALAEQMDSSQVQAASQRTAPSTLEHLKKPLSIKKITNPGTS